MGEIYSYSASLFKHNDVLNNTKYADCHFK